MKIVQVCPQSDWVLSIVAEDGRMGKFDVRPYLADEAFEIFAIPANSRRSSMVATLWNGIVALIYPPIPSKRVGK